MMQAQAIATSDRNKGSQATARVPSSQYSLLNCIIPIASSSTTATTQTQKIKQERFPDFPGAIKSLGGWGGDFVMGTGQEEAVFEYFNNKGFKTTFAR